MYVLYMIVLMDITWKINLFQSLGIDLFSYYVQEYHWPYLCQLLDFSIVKGLTFYQTCKDINIIYMINKNINSKRFQ